MADPPQDSHEKRAEHAFACADDGGDSSNMIGFDGVLQSENQPEAEGR